MNIEIPKHLIHENEDITLKTDLLNNKLIVGCCGQSRSGKDTLAKELSETYGYKRIAFGDALKETMNEHLKEIVHQDLLSKRIDIPLEKINFLEEKDKLIKEALRPYMIFFGEEMRRINGKFYWIHKAFEKIGDSNKVVISDVRRIDELDIFRGNVMSQNRQLENLIYAGYHDTENIVNFDQKFESILFHINQYKLQDKDELTVKAIQMAHEDWLFADTIYIDSRIPEDHRETYIKTKTYLMHTKYSL
jgi:hypothetical protein